MNASMGKDQGPDYDSRDPDVVTDASSVDCAAGASVFVVDGICTPDSGNSGKQTADAGKTVSTTFSIKVLSNF